LFYAVKQRFGDKDVATFVKKYYSEALQASSSSSTATATAARLVPSVLIYVNTQHDAAKVAGYLQDALSGVHDEVVVGFYHAGSVTPAPPFDASCAHIHIYILYYTVFMFCLATTQHIALLFSRHICTHDLPVIYCN
jgi:hypothetical protein